MRAVTHIGLKAIIAVAMTRGEYNLYRGWIVPKDENPGDFGYLVEYMEGGKPNDPRHQGYISWSPKDVFEKAYHSNDGQDTMPFGVALEFLKVGYRIARTGWNGKSMWLTLSPGNKDLPSGNFWSPHNKKFAELRGGYADVLPSITMKTADDKILMGWLASQTDMLSSDWVVIP